MTDESVPWWDVAPSDYEPTAFAMYGRSKKRRLEVWGVTPYCAWAINGFGFDLPDHPVASDIVSKIVAEVADGVPVAFTGRLDIKGTPAAEMASDDGRSWWVDIMLLRAITTSGEFFRTEHDPHSFPEEAPIPVEWVRVESGPIVALRTFSNETAPIGFLATLSEVTP